MKKLKKLISGLMVMALAVSIFTAFLGSSAKAAGFTTLVSGNAGYVGACKRMVDGGGYGQFVAVDTIAISSAGTQNHARANVSVYNASFQEYQLKLYHATNGSWDGGTVYALPNENIKIWANLNSGAAGVTNTLWLWQIGWC